MRRVFVPEAGVQAARVVVAGPEAHYVRQVLRLGRGDRFAAVLPTGEERVATVERVTDGAVEAALGETVKRGADASVDVRIRPALVKGRKLDLVIQKCTELGASGIAPVLCERSVSRPDAERASRKAQRWQKIAEEAARQCGRSQPPRVAEPIPLAQAIAETAQLGGTGLILAPEGESGGAAAGRLLPGEPRLPIIVLVGPEGGFSPDEVALAREAGLHGVSLGRRILRAETAAIVICALLMRELGELG